MGAGSERPKAVEMSEAGAGSDRAVAATAAAALGPDGGRPQAAGRLCAESHTGRSRLNAVSKGVGSGSMRMEGICGRRTQDVSSPMQNADLAG